MASGRAHASAASISWKHASRFHPHDWRLESPIRGPLAKRAGQHRLGEKRLDERRHAGEQKAPTRRTHRPPCPRPCRTVGSLVLLVFRHPQRGDQTRGPLALHVHDPGGLEPSQATSEIASAKLKFDRVVRTPVISRTPAGGWSRRHACSQDSVPVVARVGARRSGPPMK